MSNATKTLAITFAALLVLTGLSEWLSGPSASEAFQGELLTFDSTAVRQIAIAAPGDSVVLQQRNGGQWIVKRGNAANDTSSYSADSAAVRQALGALSELEVSRVVTRQPQKHVRFGVDSTGTQVHLLGEGEKSLARLVVGQPQIASRRDRNTYVRRSDEPSVYVVNRFLPSVVKTRVEDWRNKRVWTLDRSRITRLQVQMPGDSSYVLQRAATDSSVWAFKARGDTLSPNQARPLLQQVASVRASGFLPSASPKTLREAPYQVQLQLDDGSQRTLRLGKEASSTYRAAASGYPYVFIVRRSAWNETVFQSPATLQTMQPSPPQPAAAPGGDSPPPSGRGRATFQRRLNR